MTLWARAGWWILPALLLLLPTVLRAQGWRLEASAGRVLYDPLFERVGAVNAGLGVRYEGDRGRWAYLSGGVDLDAAGPSWAGAGLGGWLGVERGDLSLGADLGAQLFGYTASVAEEGGGVATLEVLPTAVLRKGSTEAALYAGMVQTAYRSEGVLLARGALDAGASVAVEPLTGLRVGAEGRYLQVEEGARPYLGATARYSRGVGTVWVFGGRWLKGSIPTDPSAGYGVGASLRLPGRMEVLGSWQQEPSDPLYLSSARRTWSVRLSRALSRRVEPAAPLPVVVPEPAGGWTSFRIPVSEHPEAPSILGDFTGWEPVPMKRSGGFWEARLAVAPGVYHYGFRSASGEWFVPDSLLHADDGMGGTSAVLVVP